MSTREFAFRQAISWSDAFNQMQGGNPYLAAEIADARDRHLEEWLRKHVVTTKNAAGDIEIAAGQAVQSANFVAGVSGWQIDGTGSVEFNSGTFRGTLEAGQIDIPDANITASSFHVASDGSGWVGATTSNKANAPMQWGADGVLTFLDSGSGATVVIDTGTQAGGLLLGSGDVSESNPGSLYVTASSSQGIVSLTAPTIGGGTHPVLQLLSNDALAGTPTGSRLYVRAGRVIFDMPDHGLVGDKVPQFLVRDQLTSAEWGGINADGVWVADGLKLGLNGADTTVGSTYFTEIGNAIQMHTSNVEKGRVDNNGYIHASGKRYYFGIAEVDYVHHTGTQFDFFSNNVGIMAVRDDGDVWVRGSNVDGGIVLGQAFSTSYVGLRTENMSRTSASEYLLISDGTHHFISAPSAGNLYLRAGGNSSTSHIDIRNDGDILIDGDVHLDNSILYFGALGADDYIGYNETNNTFQFVSDGDFFDLDRIGADDFAFQVGGYRVLRMLESAGTVNLYVQDTSGNGVLGSSGTSNSAAHIDPANGRIYELTSSRRFKKNISRHDLLADIDVLPTIGHRFRVKKAYQLDPDGDDVYLFGPIAEHLAEMHPKLVTWDAEGPRSPNLDVMVTALWDRVATIERELYA